MVNIDNDVTEIKEDESWPLHRQIVPRSDKNEQAIYHFGADVSPVADTLVAGP